MKNEEKNVDSHLKKAEKPFKNRQRKLYGKVFINIFKNTKTKEYIIMWSVGLFLLTGAFFTIYDQLNDKDNVK